MRGSGRRQSLSKSCNEMERRNSWAQWASRLSPGDDTQNVSFKTAREKIVEVSSREMMFEVTHMLIRLIRSWHYVCTHGKLTLYPMHFRQYISIKKKTHEILKLTCMPSTLWISFSLFLHWWQDEESLGPRSKCVTLKTQEVGTWGVPPNCLSRWCYDYRLVVFKCSLLNLMSLPGLWRLLA